MFEPRNDHASTAANETPALPPLAVASLTAIAALKIAIHLAAINQYGYFRDELYYLASTEHLHWGYVEHPPLSIFVLAGVRAVIGDSLAALRLVPVLAGAATVWVTGLITWRLGGGRFAQSLSALCVVMAPVLLGTGRYYSMNAIDLLLWSVAALSLLLALQTGRTRRWVVLGVVLGLGLLNKVSMAWFCGGLAVALIVTPYRSVLKTPGPWWALAVAAACFAPHVVWQFQNGWPTLEFMYNATSEKMSRVTPLEFMRLQLLVMNVAAAPVWIAGILYGLMGRAGGAARVFVVIFLAVAALLVSEGHSRDYYLSVAYPMVLAIGALAVARFTARARVAWVRPVTLGLVVVLGAPLVPLALPVLSAESFVRYQSAMGQGPRSEERNEMGSLPQHYADMFGWEEMVDLVAEAYARLSPEERGRCRVFGQNYGEAGAVDVLGRRRGLPRAMSSHNSYWLWSAGEEWDILIIIGGDREDNAEFFEDIEVIGQTSSPWSMPYERGRDVSIARRPRKKVADIWPSLKAFI